MATVREAKATGINTGYGIAEDNFRELFERYVLENDAVQVGEEDKLIDFIVSETLETEQEHYRQFSPFEFTAREFNESRDPDAVWEAYDDGVAKGARQAAKLGIKTLLKVYALERP